MLFAFMLVCMVVLGFMVIAQHKPVGYRSVCDVSDDLETVLQEDRSVPAHEEDSHEKDEVFVRDQGSRDRRS